MRILTILHDSIVDGNGLRTVLFFAGCPHRCPSCHNPQSWNADGGVEWTEEEVLQEVMENELSHVTFSGGEPFLQSKEIIPLAQKIKQNGKNIWCYTGYLFEELLQNSDHALLLEYVDVLVDGKFEIANRDLSLKYKGSSNQRIINVGKSLAQGEIILAVT
ncbi:anaerobic ribonucleoside-triphosphate reductase activating protein [Cytobacillus sp. Hz8]|uniref:anaerobic ribonucleoside-triphosphate reductase activating protein n=1 Tax=Cytobacillus sp. Hz8 TaxID=3347168 RepID=UPI0035D71760